ncbi:MAG TPA: hypothetical protein DGG95_06325 [Cytophagales bacterium]|jgi:hypothetical protein|nr:hypothetical protein [Cytophagales bacterium]
MELLETQDPERKKLLETSHRHRQEMERELKNISDGTEKILKNALIVGGALALTYVVVSQLSSSKKKKKKNKPVVITEPKEVVTVEEGESMLSKMGDKLINAATALLLDLAKDKLTEYLQTRNKKNENS